MVFKDFVSAELSQLILLQAGEVVLDGYGIFNSGIDLITAQIRDYAIDVTQILDGIFPLDE